MCLKLNLSSFCLPLAAGSLSLASAIANAQQPQDRERDLDSNALEEEVIVVTGSRLLRPGLESPIPVTSLGAEAIEQSGVTNMVDIVNELPAIGLGAGTKTNTRGAGSIGTSLLNLRSLGTNRTLVLVNGRRHVGAVAGGSAVDINSIPRALVEQVEVSTGGASVAYGADAVTGVVNFILKDEFDGVQVDGQFGQSAESDGETTYLSITGGKNFADDRLKFVFNLSYDDTEGVRGLDRAFTRKGTGFGTNPADTGVDDGIPNQILYDNTRINITNETGILLGALTGSFGPGGLFAFDADTNFVPYDFGTPIGGSFSEGGDGYAFNKLITITNPLERLLLDTRLKYELSGDHEFFVEAKYVNTEGSNVDQPTGDFFSFRDGDNSSFFLSSENPYLPFENPDFAAFFAANTVPGVGEFVLYSRFHEDLGVRTQEVDRDVFRLAFGFDGYIEAIDSSYEVFYQYGETDYDLTVLNNRNSRRFALAVDAVSDGDGNPVCRATRDAGGPTGDPDIDECLPLNIFGANNFDQAARDYAMVDLKSNGKLEQSVFGASLAGSLFDMGDKPVLYAAGFEWRKEESAFNPDPLQISGNNFDGLVPVTKGDFQVSELFAEVMLPLVADLPAAKSVELEAGARLSDYDSIGNTEAFRANLTWVPVDGLRFRGGIAEAVRAPNINELFAPSGETFALTLDPCDTANINNTENPARRAANCAALGVPVDYTDPQANVFKSVLGGGNPDLQEEVAESLTYGVVISPWDNFSLSLDWFDIEIEDAIFSESSQSIVDNCVDLFDTIDNQFCDRVTRDADTSTITSVSSIPINIGALEVKGLDFQLDYAVNFGEWGDLQTTLVGTHLDELNIVPTGEVVDIDKDAGEVGSPELQANLSLAYHLRGLTASWQMRYIGEQEISREDDDFESRNPHEYGSYTLNDMQLRYEFGLQSRYTTYFGVNNVFDREPPRGVGRSELPLFDAIGRYFYVGASLAFK